MQWVTANAIKQKPRSIISERLQSKDKNWTVESSELTSTETWISLSSFIISSFSFEVNLKIIFLPTLLNEILTVSLLPLIKTDISVPLYWRHQRNYGVYLYKHKEAWNILLIFLWSKCKIMIFYCAFTQLCLNFWKEIPFSFYIQSLLNGWNMY